MLPAGSRLRRRPDFTAALRRGRRATTPRLVVHLGVRRSVNADADAAAALGAEQVQPRAGFVVGRVVGGAVVRNRVRRQLRHLVAARLPMLPAGSDVVVRAMPAAAAASSAQLADDLDRALRRVAPGRRP